MSPIDSWSILKLKARAFLDIHVLKRKFQLPSQISTGIHTKPESWCVEFHEPPTAPPRKGGRFIQQQKIRSPDLMFFSKLQRPMSLCICRLLKSTVCHCGFQGHTRNFGCKLGKFHASHPSMSKYQAPAVGRV